MPETKSVTFPTLIFPYLLRSGLSTSSAIRLRRCRASPRGGVNVLGDLRPFKANPATLSTYWAGLTIGTMWTLPRSTTN